VITFKMEGVEQMRQNILKVAAKFPDMVAKALYIEGQIEMTESKRRTPVATGVLRASGFVNNPVRSGRNISVTLGFGGAAEKYAVIVHEDLDAFHPVGQAKYLESVLNESRDHMAARLAKRVNLNVGKL